MTPIYEDKDGLPHPADGDEWWQESVVVTWWDDAAGLGGFARIGHEVGQGSANVWLGVVTATGERFRFCHSALPLTDADRDGDGFITTDGTSLVAEALRSDGGQRWRMERPGFSADLVLSDFYPMLNMWALGSETNVATDIAPNHWEASGRLTGTVRLGTSTYDLNALYHRDHSWGVRHWDTARTHRWVAGTCGPELSFVALTWHSRDGQLSREGFVNRQGRNIPATDIDVLAYMEADGTTTRGGRLRMGLADGTALDLEATAVDGLLSDHRGIECVDSICRVRTSDGLTGFCDFETTENTRLGSEPTTLALGAVRENGLSRRP